MSLGDLFGTDDSEAQGYLQQALQQYQQANVPTVASEQVNNLPQETVQGVVNPNQIQAVNQASSGFNNIALDPATRQAQINALSQYSNIANQGGLDANAKLALQQAMDQANVQSQGAQGAIQNQAQAMGQGGGDFALTQRAIAAQGASNTGAEQGLQTAAMAEANRETALNQMANIGGNVNASDYAQQAQKAAAQNQINAADQGFQNQANVGNVANNMMGQQFNVQNAQEVNAENTAAKQGNAYYNAQLPQQQFNNEMAKAGGMAGVNQSQAGVAQQSQQNAANATGQLLKGGLTVAGTALGGPLGGAAANAFTGGGGNTQTGSFQNTPQAHGNNQNFAPYQNAAHGGMIGCYAEGGKAHNHYMCMLMGGPVPGKAKVDGDSETNDTVPAMLSPGEIVVKRSKADNPDEAAKEAKKISLENFSKGYKRSK